MECNKVQEKLSALIDRILSQDEKILVEEHLKSCEKCREALSELEKTIGHIKNQEEIEPPSWLTQKVMAKIKAEAAPKKGLFEKLFYPLHIKLPLGAVATIAIAVTTIYIFKSIQPEIQLAKAPPEEITRNTPSPDIEKNMPSSSAVAKSESTKQSQQTAAEPKISKDRSDSYLAKKEVLQTERDKAYVLGEGTSVAGKPSEQPMPAKEPESMKFAAPKAPAPVMKEDKAMPSAGVGIMDGIKREAAQVKGKNLGYKSGSQGIEEKTNRKITYTTDRKVYVQGDDVHITAVNISENDVSIVDRNFIDGGFAKIKIMAADGHWGEIELFAAANVLVSKTLKQGEAHVYTWKTAGYNKSNTVAAPGIYRICFGGQICTDNFEIKASNK